MLPSREFWGPGGERLRCEDGLCLRNAAFSKLRNPGSRIQGIQYSQHGKGHLLGSRRSKLRGVAHRPQHWKTDPKPSNGSAHSREFPNCL